MKEGSFRFLALEGACVDSIHKAPRVLRLRWTQEIASTQGLRLDFGGCFTQEQWLGHFLPAFNWCL